MVRIMLDNNKRRENLTAKDFAGNQEKKDDYEAESEGTLTGVHLGHKAHIQKA